MRDVTEQLTAYFDATVERVTAEDVLAGSRVRGQNGRLEPTRTPRLRPAWVLAAGFVATVVLVGGAVGVARVLESDSAGVGTAPSPASDTADGLSGPWTLLIAAGAILMLAVVGLVWRNRIEIVKEQTMQTLERPEVEVSPRPRSPANLILLVAVLVLAAGALGWWIGSSGGDDVGDVPQIVEQLNQAWVDGDADGVAALYTEEGIYEDMELELPTSIRGERYIGTSQIVSHARQGMNAADFEEMRVNKVMTLDNLIVYEWTASGISYESPFEATGVIVLEMEDGLIARSFYYYFSPELFGP
jgi:ketosteroid isomerase-like protein